MDRADHRLRGERHPHSTQRHQLYQRLNPSLGISPGLFFASIASRYPPLGPGPETKFLDLAPVGGAKKFFSKFLDVSTKLRIFAARTYTFLI